MSRAELDAISEFTRVHSPPSGRDPGLRGLWSGVNAFEDALCLVMTADGSQRPWRPSAPRSWIAVRVEELKTRIKMALPSALSARSSLEPLRLHRQAPAPRIIWG